MSLSKISNLALKERITA